GWSRAGAGGRWRRTRPVAAACARSTSGCGPCCERGEGSGMNLERQRGAHAQRGLRAAYRWLWRLWRALLWREDNGLRVETVSDMRIVVLPGVFNGARLRTGAFLAQTLDSDTCPPGARALDLSTGSGLGATFAARSAARVLAPD